MYINNTEKYEVVIGVQTDTNVSRVIERQLDLLIEAWQKHAKNYFDMRGIYISAIANKGNAIYNEDWGCPHGGERVVTFNCTRNPKFIDNNLDYYNGLMYIVSCLKEEFKQHTITITKMGAIITYATDEDFVSHESEE